MRNKIRGPQTVQIESLNENGCGFPPDKKIAVFGALPGETVIAAPITFKKKMLYARAESVENPSPHRVEPLCEVASHCGGCSFQHLDHAMQIQNKSDLLKDALAPVVPVQWLEPLTHTTAHYRSKARLGVRYVPKKERVLVGFREKMKPYITDTPSCPVLVDPIATLVEPLAEMISQLSQPDKLPQIEVSCGDETSAMIFRHLEDLTESDLALFATFADQYRIMVFLQPAGLDSVHALDDAQGQPELSYSLPEYDLTYQFSPTDFTQVNLGMNRLMVKQAINLLELSDEDSVLDAFCGIGNFSLAMARHAKRVYGVEQSIGSIDRARYNAAFNHIGNAEFSVADLHAEVP
ncbi:MAG: 23S rRNA (uracil1939-C5)-methyltransferase, partial [Candidatus Azotimanducaceae bacterium]